MTNKATDYQKVIMQLTWKQMTWIKQQGGRTIGDILVDNYGPYVVMSTPTSGAGQRVYVPKDKALTTVVRTTFVAVEIEDKDVKKGVNKDE